MTIVQVQGKGKAGLRAGARALSLLSVPLNVHVLTELEEGPRSLIGLRRAAGAPQTTMRGHLRNLTELGILERRRESAFPGSVGYQLARPGRDLLGVAEVLRGWLAAAPEGPLTLGTAAAKNSIKALIEGWSLAIVRALSARPLSLTDLNRLISGLSYPSLERRLAAMRLAGLIEPTRTKARGNPYGVTDWLRHAVAPILAATRWERRYAPQQAPPITRIDAEATFLLSVPLLDLPRECSGACRLAVELPNGGGEDLAGVVVEVEEGRVVSCTSRLRGSAVAWVSGPVWAWLGAVIDEETDGIEIGGDYELGLALLGGLHRIHFPLHQRV